MKNNVIYHNDIWFPAVYCRICRRKILTSNQTLRCIRKCIRIRDNCLQNCQSSVLRLEISLKVICDRKTHDLPPQIIFNAVIPILMYLTFLPFKLHFSAQQGSTVSKEKPDVCQWKGMLRNDTRFPTVTRRIYCCRFLTSSSQTEVH